MSATPNSQGQRLRVHVEPQDFTEAEASAGQELPISPLQAAPATSAGSMVVPSESQLELALSNARDSRSLVHLHNVVTAWQKASEQFDLAHEEIVRLAESRLRIERKLGAELAQVVKRGRPRLKVIQSDLFQDGEDGRLPSGVTQQMSDGYRKLAAVPESAFEAYLAEARERRKVPSASAARAHAAKLRCSRRIRPKKPTKGGAVAASTGDLPEALLDVVQRVLGDIDVCVGLARVRCKRRLKSDTLDPNHLRGNVFVAACPEPGKWLPELAKLRRDACVLSPVLAWPQCAAARPVQPSYLRGVVLDVRSEMSGDRPA